jgi:outer membrane protein
MSSRYIPNGIWLLMLLAVAAMPSSAQGDTLRLTLESATDYALKNSGQIEIARLEVQKSEKHAKAYLADGLPQLNGSVQYTNYPALPVQLIPAEFIGGQPGEFFEVQFGLPHNLTASVNLSQMVFDTRYFLGLKASRMLVDLSERQLERKEYETRHQVEQAYYNVMLAEEMLAMLDRNISVAVKLRDETKALNEAGFVEAIEVDRVQLALNNLNTQRQSVVRNIALAYGLLKFQMGMDITAVVKVTESIETYPVKEPALLEAQTEFQARTDYSLLDMQENLTEVNIKNIRSGYYPNAYLFGTLQANAQRNSFNFTDADAPWFGAVFTGITLNIPIWDSQRRANQIQQQRLEVMQIRRQKQDLRQAIGLELLQARDQYRDALEALESEEANLVLAERIFDVATRKYNEGVGSSLELTSAQSTLYQTQSAYIGTLHRLLLARADLRKALEQY